MLNERWVEIKRDSFVLRVESYGDCEVCCIGNVGDVVSFGWLWLMRW